MREEATKKASKQFHRRPEPKKKRWKPVIFTLHMKSNTIMKFKMLSTIKKSGFSSILKPLKTVTTTKMRVVANIRT